MKLSAKMWPTAVLVLAALGAWWWHGREQRTEGALREQIAALKRVSARLIEHADSVDREYRVDTVRLVRWRTSYTTAHDTLRLTDTVAVRAFVLIADSTIKACSVALETCEHRVAVRDSLLSEQSSLIQLLKSKKSPRFGCYVGGVASDQGVRPGVGCGLRLTK